MRAFPELYGRHQQGLKGTGKRGWRKHEAWGVHAYGEHADRPRLGAAGQGELGGQARQQLDGVDILLLRVYCALPVSEYWQVLLVQEAM